jgi:uncharacterized repeat protein (TIGR03803 family)
MLGWAAIDLGATTYQAGNGYQVLHAFSAERGRPGSLLYASDGKIYGTTESGGRYGRGSIFVLTRNGPGWDLTTLWEFSGIDGDDPSAGLIQGPDGHLYGVTQWGGTLDQNVWGRVGYGTVFHLDTTGSLTTLHRFGFADGARPNSRLLIGSDGALYGTTTVGGSSTHYGTVFRLDLTGSFATLHNFSGANGAEPFWLVADNAGGYVGTTRSGGAHGRGSVFRLDSAGTFTSLHSFQGADGAYPNAGLVKGSDGSFYGTTEYGGALDIGGTVFRVDAAGALTTLHHFTTRSGPSGLVEAGGNLYGTIQGSGGNGVWGTIFRLDSLGSLTILHEFTLAEGGNPSPSASLLYGPDGNLYGATQTAWGPGYGTVFEATLGGSLTVLHRFSGNRGLNPLAELVQGSDGKLYGTAEFGGAAGVGTIFRMDSSGSLDVVHSFSGYPTSDGARPQAGLLRGSDGNFYGTTDEGGPGDGGGTIFRLDSSGLVTVLHGFVWDPYCGCAPPAGSRPRAALVQSSDGALLGTASDEGLGFGTVFRFADGQLTTLHAFSGPDGANPHAALAAGADGSWYGTTLRGGLHNLGTIFEIDTAGGLTVRHSFSGSDGSSPFAPLVRGGQGAFYGTTTYGGSSDAGTVFRLDVSGSLTTLHHFNVNDGGEPSGIVAGNDGRFYGVTWRGGQSDLGTVFSIDVAGTVTTLHSFNGSDGAGPWGRPVVTDAGQLCGTTVYGGPYNGGVVYCLPLPPNTSVGSNVSVPLNAPSPLQLTFQSVTAAGTTTATAIDPTTAVDVPGGFAISEDWAYQIETTAEFSGPVLIAFVVPGEISEADFNNLVVLHNENGLLVNVTATSPARDYATRTLYAITSSFSPFYLARIGPRVSVLFDQTKAHKSGSTVPIKVRLLNAAGANISSPTVALMTRSLLRTGDAESTVIVDSGQANPDAGFRYDSLLAGYVFNLSTKELTPGRWVLSFRVQGDDAFRYLVSFQIR